VGLFTQGACLLCLAGDVRTADKLHDGMNNTTDDTHMCAATHFLPSCHFLRLFPEQNKPSCLVLAYLNRDLCWQRQTGAECSEHCKPRRWLAPLRRQLSGAVLAACASARPSPDRASLPDAARAHNLLVLTLDQPAPLSGLRVWNYNKSAADTARGVKRMVVLAGECQAGGQ
jgi:hypothetical protein